MNKTFLQLLCLPCLLLGLLFSHHSLLQAEIYDPSASVFRFQKKMAERGDISSQFKLGLMYETGSGVEADLEQANFWYKKAASLNYKPAQNRLTYLEIKQSGFREKHQQWLKNLKNDARFNEGEALFLLGQMYAEGTGVNKSLTRSIKLLRKASAANIPGSETEIIRIENELIELQKQYLTEEEKKAVAPIAVIPARPVTQKPVTRKPAGNRLPNNKQATTVHKKPATARAIKTPPQSPVVNSSKTTIKPTAAKTSKTSIPASTTKPVPQSVQNRKSTQQTPDESHPVDTICSGRNLFSSGCR